MGDPKALIDVPAIDKHCFVYCGDDLCTCSAGPNWPKPVADTPAPVATPEAFWVIERRKYLDGMGFDNGRPVYATAGLRPGDHSYTQEIDHAKQFPTREAAAEWLRSALRDNEAFEVHEHMMMARATEIEQVRAERDDARTEAADLLRALQKIDGGEEAMLSELRRAIAERDLARIALTSSKAEIERVTRERDEARAGCREAVDMFDANIVSVGEYLDRAEAAEARVTALERKLGRHQGERNTLTDILNKHFAHLAIEWEEGELPSALLCILDDLKAAEARVATLTAEVGRMREKLTSIQRHAAPRADRTFDQLIRDVGWIDDLARAALASPIEPEGET